VVVVFPLSGRRRRLMAVTRSVSRVLYPPVCSEYYSRSLLCTFRSTQDSRRRLKVWPQFPGSALAKLLRNFDITFEAHSFPPAFYIFISFTTIKENTIAIYLSIVIIKIAYKKFNITPSVVFVIFFVLSSYVKI
jgi:hypothetical protein